MSTIIQVLRYRIVSIAKRNENVQKCKHTDVNKNKTFMNENNLVLIKHKQIFALLR